MDLSELKLSVRTHNLVCRAGLMNISDLYNWQRYRRDELQKWVGKKALAEIDEAFAELEDKGMLEFTTKLPPAPAEATTPEYLAAYNLNARIHYCKDSVERGLAEMCIGIEQMRDGKQYKALGYSNFEEYCQTEFGFSQHQGIKYADVGKMLESENCNSSYNFEVIGINKLHLLAKLDEPTREAVTETIDVESVTVKELKSQIAELTNDKNKLESETADLSQQLDAAQETIRSKAKQFKEAMESKNRDITRFNKEKTDANEKLRKKHAEWVRAQNENATLTGKIYDLEKQIKELESRPVEVAVSEDEAKEIEQLKAELDDVNLRLQQADKTASAKAEHAAALVRDEYEEKLANAQKTEPDEAALDAACFQSFRLVFEKMVDEMEDFLETLHDGPRIEYINKLDDYWTENLLYLRKKGEGAGA